MMKTNFNQNALFSTAVLVTCVAVWWILEPKPAEQPVLVPKKPKPPHKWQPAKASPAPKLINEHKLKNGKPMPDTGLILCGNGNNDASFGTYAWSSAGQIASADATPAQATLDEDTTQYLVADFSGLFSGIPLTATIEGIEVTWSRSYLGGLSRPQASDARVNVGSGGTIFGHDKSIPGAWPTTTPADQVYGGALDLWSRSWTVAEIYNLNAAIAAASEDNGNIGSARVYYCKARVYYDDTFVDAVGTMSNPSGLLMFALLE